MRQDTSFDYITEKATKPAKRWSAKDLARFHQWNPNGVVARKRKTDEKISELVDLDRIPSGALYTVGSLFDLYTEKSFTAFAWGAYRKDGEEIKFRVTWSAVNWLARDYEDAIAKAGEIIEREFAAYEAEKAAGIESDEERRELIRSTEGAFDFLLNISKISEVTERFKVQIPAALRLLTTARAMRDEAAA